jgi:membrane protease YdiL (CAAX protease family)
VGQVLELVLAFLLLPLILCTMDAPPWMGGRVLVWIGTLFLLARLPLDVRARLFQRLRPAASLPGGWIGPMALFLLSMGVLSMAYQLLGVWEPPQGLEMAGLPAVLLAGVLTTLFTVLPLELLFRAYFPTRFQGLFGRRQIWLALLSAFLFSWFHIPTLQPLLLLSTFVLGGLLALMERAGWPFWGILCVHALAAWSWMMAPKLVLEVFPWA